MEESKSTDVDDHFFDASDEFPFFDCSQNFESSDNSFLPPQTPLPFSPNSFRSPGSGSLRRRRSSSLNERSRKFRQDLGTLQEGGDNVTSEEVDLTSMSVSEGVNVEQNKSFASTVTMAGDNGEASSLERENDDEQFNFLVFIAELLIKSISLQINLLIRFITFPFSMLYYSFMIVVNPFYVFRQSRDCMIRKLLRLWNLVCDYVSPWVSGWIDEHKWILKFVLRFGWGIFWSVFVGLILVSLLFLAFVIGGLIVRYSLVEEPFQLNQALNFDYTKSRPTAFVPIIACPSMEGKENNGYHGGLGVRMVPSGYKLQNTVTLVLPESDYNRNLGVFQVRVEFLSENGKSLASLSRPCMLKFRSEPIRLLLTFFKIIPLVAGYISESQTLSLKLGGYTESTAPTACLKVTIEQRAEFRSRAGIPEVYGAFLHIESDLPFVKRIMWYWRRTIFVWLSMIVFLMELVFALLCYGALMIPRARSSNTNRRSLSQGNHQAQT